MKSIVWYILCCTMMLCVFPWPAICSDSPCEDSLYLYLKNEKIESDMSSGELKYFQIMQEKCERYQKEERRDVEDTYIRRTVRRRIVLPLVLGSLLIILASVTAVLVRN